MEKKIEDYLHLYLPYDIKVMFYDGERGKTVISEIASLSKEEIILNDPEDDYVFDLKKDSWALQLILRPLPDITDKEFAEMLEIANQNNYKLLERDEIVLRQTAPEIMRYLLSKSFDLFGFIDAGLAIDKTKI
jgi:hypothetical protein